jgi:hypothetical protein
MNLKRTGHTQQLSPSDSDPAVDIAFQAPSGAAKSFIPVTTQYVAQAANSDITTSSFHSPIPNDSTLGSDALYVDDISTELYLDCLVHGTEAPTPPASRDTSELSCN